LFEEASWPSCGGRQTTNRSRKKRMETAKNPKVELCIFVPRDYSQKGHIPTFDASIPESLKKRKVFVFPVKRKR
jgi:hypothetical protein